MDHLDGDEGAAVPARGIKRRGSVRCWLQAGVRRWVSMPGHERARPVRPGPIGPTLAGGQAWHGRAGLDSRTVARALTRRARWARRRQRRMARLTHDLTDAQWMALTAAWGGCAYCGAGGTRCSATASLPSPAGPLHAGRTWCRHAVPCKASKSNGGVTRWLRRRRFAERQFLLRHSAIHQDARLPADRPVGFRHASATSLA